MIENQKFYTFKMSKRKKTAPVIDSDSDESDSGSNLDEVCISFHFKRNFAGHS